MSILVAPEWVATAAADVADVGSAVGAANAAAAAQTTGLLAAAEDEVSAAVAALFSAHGEGYQVFSAEVARFHTGFAQALTKASGAYAAAEAASANPLAAFEDAVAGFEQSLQQAPAAAASEFTRLGDALFTEIFGAPARPPFPSTGPGGFTGQPSILTRFEETALWPVKPLLSLSGLETQIASPSNPLLQLLTGDIPVLDLVIGNKPPELLTLLLGETVQYTTYEGMRVVQITPAHPTGEYVVAIHGGAFIFPPSIFHWLNYTVMAHQTGATFEVPIYPLLQQGGTAGTVVPTMANFISSQVTQYGSSNVSVIGDSAGGNLALAAVELMVANNQTVPSAMVLLSPWLDLTMTNPNIAFVQDPLLPVLPAQLIGKAWAGGLPVTNPMVSPLYGSLSGLPPTYFYTGNLDILSPDVLVIQQRALNTVGSQFYYMMANGMIHDFVILTPDGFQYWPQIERQLGIAA